MTILDFFKSLYFIFSTNLEIPAWALTLNFMIMIWLICLEFKRN